MNVDVSGEKVKNPKENANLLSKITFFYNVGIIWKTYKTGTFKESQLHEVPRKCKAATSGDELEKYLKKDLEENMFSLTRVLFKCYGAKYLILGILQLLVRSLVIIIIPMTLSKVVLYFQPGQTDLSKRDVILFASLLIILNFLNVTYLHNYLLTISELGVKIRTAVCSVIFRKCLKISSAALSDLGIGKIVTLMTKDVNAIETFILYFNDTWVGVVQVLIVFYLLYGKTGLSALIGMGLYVAIIPVQILIGKITSTLKFESCRKADKRLQKTKEALSAISVIKMNNWEDHFEESINKSRLKEIRIMLKIVLCKIVILLLSSLTSKIVFCCLLTSYVLLGNVISAELVYYVSMLFLRIRHASNVAIPIGVTVIAEMNASMKRIEQLLTTKEICMLKNEVEGEKNAHVYLIDVCTEINNIKIINNINLKVDCAGLIIISGSIGSGKTTLLKTILGEYELQKGTILKEGIISYASQEPWIFPSTLKQNIIFDEQFDPQRYLQVLDVCALNVDLRQIPKGDSQTIGDKGTNLSKGQKARINLARAIYKKADIYLIDDVLSSLDTHVQKHVFEKCIKTFLADKICIFVTRTSQFIREGNTIVILDKGEIIFTQKITDINKIELKTFLQEDQMFERGVEVNNNLEDLEKISESSTLLTKTSNKDKIYEESQKSGKVSFKVYRQYCTFGGGFFIVVLFLILFIGTHFSRSYTDKILGNWVNVVHENVITDTMNTSTQQQIAPSLPPLLNYITFTISTTVLSIVSTFLLFNFSRKASLGLHKTMTNSVLNSSMKCFNKHLIGNILNRFSKDLNIVDEQIPFAFYEFLEIFFGIIGIVILLATVNVIFLLPTIIIFVVLYFLTQLYMPTGRNLQRLDTATRSPIIGYLNSAIEGLTTIRAFRAENVLIKEFDRHQDLNTSASFTSKGCDRTFGYYLDVCCTIFIGVIIAFFILFDKESSVGDVGLAITQAFMLTGVVQYGIRKSAEIENKMTSTERILEYINIEREINQPIVDYFGWPTDNTIKFDNVSLTYTDNDPCVLKHINLILGQKTKVGIVGRTGSGKSTLISLLFRMYPYEGIILLGGLDLRNIPLKTLRSNISIISQDPALFSGTIRTNLDPLNRHTDQEIWTVIQMVRLQNLILSLDNKITSSSNFSTGQRQLVCLARCLLTKNKLIILDEATSDMDLESENLIKIILDQYFKDCTLVIVAHRLNTVLDCNRVVVIEEGRIVENGQVNMLKKDPNSIFYSMLNK